MASVLDSSVNAEILAVSETLSRASNGDSLARRGRQSHQGLAGPLGRLATKRSTVIRNHDKGVVCVFLVPEAMSSLSPALILHRNRLSSLIERRRTCTTCANIAALHITSSDVLKTCLTLSSSILILPTAGHWVGHFVSGRRSGFIPGLKRNMNINIIREMLAISWHRHPSKLGRAWLGFLFLVTLPSHAHDEHLYEGPCLPLRLESWLYEFGDDAVVCDPCCVVILPADDPPLLVTVGSSPSVTSSHAFTTPSIVLPSTVSQTYSGQAQESGGIPGCVSSHSTASCTATTPVTPSLAFTALSPTTFSPTLAFSPLTSPPPGSTAPYAMSRPNNANVQTSELSATVVAVIAIASFLGLASLLLGVLLYARARRSSQRRSRIRISDSELGNSNTSRDWSASGKILPRPRNPYEGLVPSHVPLLPPDPGPPVIHVTALSPRLRTAVVRS
ncbi:hypothetical protein BKA82DRAFT_27918 [Pisolithus tinctorius]|nr:hypothetical protein BKA82DRAFT_27918 [Pisolithus tinctorius]